MEKAMNRKGIFFTGVVLVLITLFFITYSTINQFADEQSLRDRVKTMNSYVSSLETDMERQLYISGFRALFVLNKYIIESGQYVPDAENKMEELIFNGTLYGNPESIMEGATIPDINETINEKSAKINVDVSISNLSLEITQDDPWSVKFSLNGNVFIADQSGLASWNRTKLTEAHVSVEGFEDPIYAVETNELSNKINRSQYMPFVNGANVANLSTHAINSLYYNSTDAPSFLDRLKGTKEPNINGIESFVNLAELGSSNPSKSAIDFIYFSNTNPQPVCTVPGMPSWFKVHQSNLGTYGLSEPFASCS